MNLESKIQSTNLLLKGLSKDLNRLKQDFIEFENLTDPELYSSISSLFINLEGHLHTSLERLKRPKISLAMLGTTSSGKSTHANGLLGRELLPTDMDECSAGIVSISNFNAGDYYRQGTLTAANDVLDYKWNTDSSEEIHNVRKLQSKLKEVMKTALENREPGKQPFFEVNTAVLLSSKDSKGKLGLPDAVEIEIIDLPGIKNEKDRTNISVIRKVITQSVPIVMIDYTQIFDKDKREKVLDEVKDLYDLLSGNHQVLIFLFNKVNLVSAGESWERSKNNVVSEIKKHLVLSENVDLNLQPINSLLFSYISQFIFDRTVKNHEDNNFVNIVGRFVEEAGKYLPNYYLNNDDIESANGWNFAAHKLKQLDHSSIRSHFESEKNNELFNRYINDCLKISYTENFFENLQHTISKNKDLLIFHPIITPIKTNFKLFFDKFEIAIQVLSKKNETELASKLDKINAIKKKSAERLIGLRNEFLYEGNEIIKFFSEDKRSYDASKIKMNSALWSEILQFNEKCKDIQKDITNTVINIIIKFLKKEISLLDFNKLMINYVSAKTTENLSETISNLHFKFNYSGTKVQKSWITSRNGSNNPDSIREHKECELVFNTFMLSVRRAFAERAERWLEIRLIEIQDNDKLRCEKYAHKIQTYINQELKELDLKLPDFDFMGGIIEKPTIKDDIFEFSKKDWHLDKKSQEKKNSYRIETRSCSEDRYIPVTTTIDVTEKLIIIPSIKGSAGFEEIWDARMAEAIDVLTKHLVQGMQKSFEEYSASMDENIESILTHLERQIKFHIKNIQGKKTMNDQKINELSNESKKIQKQYEPEFSGFY